MNWFQLFIAILGSSSLTALITGIFNMVSNKQNYKLTQQRLDNDKKLKDEELKRNNEKEQAQNLYNIIKPAINNECIREYINKPGEYSANALRRLCDDLSTKKYTTKNSEDVYKWLLDGNILFDNIEHIQFNNWVVKMLSDLVYKDCSDFFARYRTLTGSTKLITIDTKKLNTDVDYINEKLNLYIEHF